MAPAQLPALLNGGGPRQRRCAAGFARAAPRAAPRAAAGIRPGSSLLLAQKSGRLAKKSVSKVGIDPTTFAWREENPKGLEDLALSNFSQSNMRATLYQIYKTGRLREGGMQPINDWMSS